MDWNWVNIAAMATVIGVIGGIVSVIFLVYEVRHNTKAIEGTTVQSLMGLEREVFGLLIDNAELFVRGSKSTSRLSARDRFKFEKIVATYMSLVYSAFVQFNRDLITEEVWEAYMMAIKRETRGPGFAEGWNRIKESYPASFRTTIDSAQVAWRREEAAVATS